VRRLRPSTFLAAVLIALGVLGFLAVVAKLTLDVDRGQFVETTTHEVYRLKGFGLTLYASTSGYLNVDVVDGVLLTATASVTTLVALGLAHGGAPKRRQWFFALLGVGVGYLAADELFSAHESIGHNLGFLTGVNEHPDNLVLASYVIPAAAFAWAFRDMLAWNRLVASLFASAAGAYVLAVLLNVVEIDAEDYVEILAAFLLLVATTVLVLQTVSFTPRVESGRAT